MSAADVPGGPLRLSTSLREATRPAHEAAEGAPFVRDLMAGALPVDAYAALVAQNHAIYLALEAATERWRDDPVGGDFVLDRLTRVPRLEADLAALLGDRWRARETALRVPATGRYAERLTTAAGTSVEAFVAHHYVRYLGDLSGGQALRAAVVRHYGDLGRDATASYTFDAIPRIKPFRDDYRGRLDRAPLDAGAVVDEAVLAFELNHDVFRELGTRYSR